jgi:molybdopterin synthase catalytic subunit
MTDTYIEVAVQTDDFSLAQQNGFADLSGDYTQVGALVSFVGKVRAEENNEVGALVALQLEHYAGMTENSLQSICLQAAERWPLTACRVIHRVGRLLVGENIVLVSVACAHRGDAFAACEYIMDYLKTQAPLWKKTIYEKNEQWVNAREQDEQALQKWQNKKVR